MRCSTTVQSVDNICSCAIQTRASTIHKTGLLNELLFAYREDIELCYQSRSIILKTNIGPQAQVFHPDTRFRDVDLLAVMCSMNRNS